MRCGQRRVESAGGFCSIQAHRYDCLERVLDTTLLCELRRGRSAVKTQVLDVSEQFADGQIECARNM